MSPASTLPPGEHSYEAILDGLREERYRFARIRAASGRLQFLVGFSPEQLRVLRREAKAEGLGLILLGSRVSGPRSRQGQLDWILREALPLASAKRAASATYPGVEGVPIEKTRIKEYGLEDPRTSDLSVLLLDPERTPAQLELAASRIERRLKGLGCSFPIRVFSGYDDRHFRKEEDFIAMGVDFLKKNLPDQKLEDHRLAVAFKELYALLNVPSAPFVRGDLANGLISAGVLSLSFALTLGFHPVIPAAGFFFGFFGRYLARFRAWIAHEPADTFLSNTLALAADTVIGIGVMALLINRVAGYGISLERIVTASSLHTLSKGSVRLALDKKFSRGRIGEQKWGVLVTVLVNFILGLATAKVYLGSVAAACFQVAVAVAGLAWVNRNPLRRLAQGLGPRSIAAPQAEELD